MDKKTKILLGAIFILGVALRFFRLTEVPPSLNWDEVSHGYNAYSILKTSRDEWGQFLPLANFRAYGDYPLPVNLYLTIPSIIVFGLNEFAVRFPSALLGSLIIVVEYFLSYSIIRNKKVALLSALFLAISPWLILPSRSVFQSTIALFFFTLGLTLFLGSVRRPILFPLSILFYGLSAYSYHTSRILTVLLLPFLLVYFIKVVWPKARSRKLLVLSSISIVGIFFVPLLFILSSSGAQARANWVFLLDQGAVNRIIEERNRSELPSFFKRLAYNRVNYFVSEFTKNYVDYFLPEFLFIKGGTQYQFSVPGKSLLFLPMLPFFYGGLLWLVWKIVKDRSPGVMLTAAWLFLAPVPAAITQGEFHVLRSSLMLPIVVMLIAFGVERFMKFLKSSRPLFLLGTLVILGSIVISLEVYLRDLLVGYPQKYSWAWQYGYKQVVEPVKESYNSYDRFLITKKYGEPHEFILFYWPWDPASFRNDKNLVRYFRSDWYWVDAFDKFIFINDWEIKDRQSELALAGRTLLITSPGNYKNGQKLETINFLDGAPAFDIIKL